MPYRIDYNARYTYSRYSTAGSSASRTADRSAYRNANPTADRDSVWARVYEAIRRVRTHAWGRGRADTTNGSRAGSHAGSGAVPSHIAARSTKTPPVTIYTVRCCFTGVHEPVGYREDL